MTKANQKVLSVFMFFYWAIIVLWAVWISVYLYTTRDWIMNERQETARIQEIKERPREAYFEYNSVSSEKSIYSLWETLRMVSDRSMRKDISIWWEDKLYCEIGDDWFRLISTKLRNSKSPTLWEDIEGRRPYEWQLPQNPIWTYIWWKCYIRSVVSIFDEWIQKKQILRSNEFTIWE